MTIELITARDWLRMDQALADACGTESEMWRCFDPTSFDLHAQPVTHGGRAAAWFVQTGPYEAVLRHYRRGGALAKWLKDRYFWTGLARTRPCVEFELLHIMWRLGLPVPRPLGAAVWRVGVVTYRAALLTQRIAQAVPLAQCVDLETWTRAGAVIADMHRHGVWHADLNVYNIMVDDQAKVWLIDFDRGRLMAFLSPERRAGNLSRLLRSVQKLSLSREQTFWLALIDGYQKCWLAGESRTQ